MGKQNSEGRKGINTGLAFVVLALIVVVILLMGYLFFNHYQDKEAKATARDPHEPRYRESEKRSNLTTFLKARKASNFGNYPVVNEKETVWETIQETGKRMMKPFQKKGRGGRAGGGGGRYHGGGGGGGGHHGGGGGGGRHHGGRRPYRPNHNRPYRRRPYYPPPPVIYQPVVSLNSVCNSLHDVNPGAECYHETCQESDFCQTYIRDNGTVSP